MPCAAVKMAAHYSILERQARVSLWPAEKRVMKAFKTSSYSSKSSLSGRCCSTAGTSSSGGT